MIVLIEVVLIVRYFIDCKELNIFFGRFVVRVLLIVIFLIVFGMDSLLMLRLLNVLVFIELIFLLVKIRWFR